MDSTTEGRSFTANVSEQSGLENFKELKDLAREVDQGVAFLERKVRSPTSFGITSDPEQAKEQALNLLKQMADACDSMQEGINEWKPKLKKTLEDATERNKILREHIDGVTRKLDEVEEDLSSRNPNYVKYEIIKKSPIAESTSLDEHGELASQMSSLRVENVARVLKLSPVSPYSAKKF